MTQKPDQPNIGDKMPDGTIFAGISPDTGMHIYAMPADAPQTMTFKEARKYASKQKAYDHNDWRLPTRKELNVLFNNRAAIPGLNLTGAGEGGWYWSSANFLLDGWGQRFDAGRQDDYDKRTPCSVRLVRSGP